HNAPDTSATDTLSLHDALPICLLLSKQVAKQAMVTEEFWILNQRAYISVCLFLLAMKRWSIKLKNLLVKNNLTTIKNLNYETTLDRKSTRLNSSHVKISYAVFC